MRSLVIVTLSCLYINLPDEEPRVIFVAGARGPSGPGPIPKLGADLKEASDSSGARQKTTGPEQRHNMSNRPHAVKKSAMRTP